MRFYFKRIFCLFLVVLILAGISPAVYAMEGTGVKTAMTEKEADQSKQTDPTELPDPTEPTEPTDSPEEEVMIPPLAEANGGIMPAASTQGSIMLFDYADNGNYTTTLNSQVTCTYKPNGTGSTKTAYIKNLGWHFARYNGVAHADEPLYCIEPWRNYGTSTSGNSADRDVTMEGSGGTSGSNVWYSLPVERREAIGLILLVL